MHPFLVTMVSEHWLLACVFIQPPEGLQLLHCSSATQCKIVSLLSVHTG